MPGWRIVLLLSLLSDRLLRHFHVLTSRFLFILVPTLPTHGSTHQTLRMLIQMVTYELDTSSGDMFIGNLECSTQRLLLRFYLSTLLTVIKSGRFILMVFNVLANDLIMVDIYTHRRVLIHLTHSGGAIR